MNSYFIGIMIGLIFVSGVLIGALIINEQNAIKTNICYDFKTLNETLEDINKNCDSTFITKKYGDSGWYIFKSNVCDGKRCENKYIPINECVINEEESE